MYEKIGNHRYYSNRDFIFVECNKKKDEITLIVQKIVSALRAKNAFMYPSKINELAQKCKKHGHITHKI